MSQERTAAARFGERFQRIAERVDSLSLRERVIIFAAVAVTLLTAVNSGILNPEFAKQQRLSEQIAADHAKVQRIQADIEASVRRVTDPDAERKAKLAALQTRLAALNGKLVAMQKGLVPPDRMPALLEDLLHHNANLKLVSLKTLPVSTIGTSGKIVLADTGTDKSGPGPSQSGITRPTSASSASPSPVPASSASASSSSASSSSASSSSASSSSASSSSASSASGSAPVYTHGVEIVMQGGYLDMLAYMKTIESMPWQIFWGRARLDATNYPDAKLTLTLFTLSLDKNWLNL